MISMNYPRIFIGYPMLSMILKKGTMNFERAFLPATLLKTKRTPLQNLMGFSSTLSNSSTIIRLQSCDKLYIKFTSVKSPWIVAVSTSGVAYPRVNVYF